MTYGSADGRSVFMLPTPVTVIFEIVPSVSSEHVAPKSLYVSSCSKSTCIGPMRVITGGITSGGGEGLGGGGNGGGMMIGGGDGNGGGAGKGGYSSKTFRGGNGGGLGAYGGGMFLGGGDKMTGGGDARTVSLT